MDTGVPGHQQLQARTVTLWGQGPLSEILSSHLKGLSSVLWLGLVKGSHFCQSQLVNMSLWQCVVLFLEDVNQLFLHCISPYLLVSLLFYFVYS